MTFTNTRHVQYDLYCKQWKTNKDASHDLVKQAKEEYLPMNDLPKEMLTTRENQQINALIKHKYNNQIWPMSVFFNFTRPTIGAWVGMIMAKKPTFQFRETQEETMLDYLLKNADGGGNGLETLSKIALESAMSTGGGVFCVCMPQSQMSTASIRDGSIAPLIKNYDRSDILDWEVRYMDGRKALSYIKLREWEFVRTAEISEVVEKHIEYFLQDGGVVYKVTRNLAVDDQYTETDYLIEAGSVATRIPCYWYGANDNDENVDPAPITPIAALNISHYQLYSRHIHQCWDAGQAQYHIDHGTQQEAQVTNENGKLVSIVEFLNPGGVKIGTNAAIHTINGGKAEILQAKTDSLLSEEPGKIEERAQKIGAQMLVESSNTTATEANLTHGASTSNLVTISDNVSKSLKAAIIHIAEVIGFDVAGINIELNKKLITSMMSAQDLQAGMQSVMQGVMPLKAFFWQLQQSGRVPSEWTFDDFKSQIEEDRGFLALAGVGVQL